LIFAAFVVKERPRAKRENQYAASDGNVLPFFAIRVRFKSATDAVREPIIMAAVERRCDPCEAGDDDKRNYPSTSTSIDVHPCCNLRYPPLPTYGGKFALCWLQKSLVPQTNSRPLAASSNLAEVGSVI
jgi:hypothetical protein